MKVDVLVVGAGYAGSVVAERLASAGRRAAPEPAIAAEKRSTNNITTIVASTRVATLNLAFAAVPDILEVGVVDIRSGRSWRPRLTEPKALLAVLYPSHRGTILRMFFRVRYPDSFRIQAHRRKLSQGTYGIDKKILHNS